MVKSNKALEVFSIYTKIDISFNESKFIISVKYHVEGDK